jgi:hypothetical protein
MKKFKYLLHICIFVCLGNILVSCNDFFEFPKTSSFTEDSIFARVDYTEKLVYQMYVGSPVVFLSNEWSYRLFGPNLDAATDGASAFSGQSKYGTHKFNFGGTNASNVTAAHGEYNYTTPWKSIRIAFTLIDRVNEVPNATTAQKERFIAESKVMIATRYFEMLKRFGGVPLIKKRINDGSEFKVGRSSVQETVDYILQLLDEAIANEYLPARVPTPLEFGRFTKAFAYGLKARTLLFAASPLFNTGTPYMSLGENNKLICYGDYDAERWNKAAIAARAAIDYCEANGYAIVDNQPDFVKNYVVATQKSPREGNTELIMGSMLSISGTDPISFYLPRGLPVSGYATNSPTHNQVKRYRNADGSFVTWPTEFTTLPNDPTGPYKNLEPRLQASIGYNGQMWYPTATLEFFNSGNPDDFPHGNNSRIKARQEFSYALRKYVHGYEDVKVSKLPWVIANPYMRLAEMYMIEAEATNEYKKEAGLSTTVAALNKVLGRSGMNVPASIDTYQKMKDFIHNEHAIEFYFEDHRFFDAKRWLQGPSLQGKIYNVDITKQIDFTYEYKEYVQEVRIWNDFYYLHPFPENEVNKQYGLIQNPGW